MLNEFEKVKCWKFFSCTSFNFQNRWGSFNVRDRHYGWDEKVVPCSNNAGDFGKKYENGRERHKIDRDILQLERRFFYFLYSVGIAVRWGCVGQKQKKPLYLFICVKMYRWYSQESKVKLLAPKVLLEYLWPMITIQSHPIQPTMRLESSWQAFDWSESTSNDLRWLTNWLLSANRIQLR